PIAAVARADAGVLAIARALAAIAGQGDGLLVLDEPTSTLDDAEVTRVLEAIRSVARASNGVIFVSHRLDEVRALADRVLVMRDGELTANRSTVGLTHDALVELILGRPLEAMIPEPPRVREGSPVIQLTGVTGRRLRGVDIAVESREIVGVTGLLGSGKSELGRILAGAETASGGRIALDGADVQIGSPRESVRLGIGYVPPERRTQGGI